jgi:hypothetical protein
MSPWEIFLIATVIILVSLLVWMTIRLPHFKSGRGPTHSKGKTETPKVAMPIDSENPPSWKVYSPKEGAPVRHCTCHPGRALQVGQAVLWWPVPHSGGAVNVFCDEGIEVDHEQPHD